MLLAFSFSHFSPWQLAFLFKDQALYVLILLRCHFPCYGAQVLQLSNMILQWNTCIIFANISTRAVEIPCPTCPTWSHFVQDKLKISIYLSLDKCGVCINKVNKNFVFHIFIYYYEFTCCIENSVDPDPDIVELHCLQES